MRSLRYTLTADDDLAAIVQHIADESGSREMAHAVARRIRQHCKRLATLPGTLGTGRPELNPGLRSTPCRGYVIFFRYGEGVLEVVNVLHAGRDIIAYFNLD